MTFHIMILLTDLIKINRFRCYGTHTCTGRIIL